MGINYNPANSGQIVDDYINTAYDTVKVVADNIAALVKLAGLTGSHQASDTEPTTRPDGSDLESGDTYFNTATSVTYTWNDTSDSWVAMTDTAVVSEVVTVDATMASTGTITLTNSYAVGDTGINVFLQGVFQTSGVDYTETDSHTLDFGSDILLEGELISVVIGTVLTVSSLGALTHETLFTTTASQAAGSVGYTIPESIKPSKKSDLNVYVQGTKQASTAYAYDSVTGIITFSGEYPDEGDEVQIINGTLINSIDIATADDVEYTPAGGTATTVASKLEEYVSVSDYCLCDGSDEVTELQKAIDQDKPVYLASDKEVAINGTLYFGHHRIFGGGTIKVIGDVNWTAAGSATRAATSGILPKAADNSIYPETTQKINIDGIKIILEKTDSGACHVGLRMENIGSGTILADIRTTGSTQNNSHALDLYQNNFNIIVDGYYESGVLGEVDGLTSVRNVGAGESSGNIVMRGIYKTLAENEAFGVYNVNGQTGTTMRGVVVDGCLILGQHKGFAWINNTSEDYDDFSGCVISNSTIVVEDIDDGGWGYAEENVGAAVSNVHVIIRSSTGAGMTNCYGFWARSWDGNRPKPKLTNCSVTVDNALTSDVLWGYSGFADLHNCGAYGDHFKFTLKTLNGTVNGGDFANGSTACVSGVTNITGNAILRGKVHNVTNDIDGVTFLLDSSVISGSNLIEVTAATTAINRKRLRFNAYLTGSSTPTRIIACSNTVQQVFDVDYYLQYPATYAPANADNLALATNLLQMYEVIWNDGTTSTRKAQAATI